MAKTVNAGLKPRNDAYTGLLAISFLALVAGAVLMALDAKELGELPKGKLAIDVPGVNPGKAGDGLRRPDAGAKIDTTDPVPAPPMPKPAEPVPAPGMSKREVEPGKLPVFRVVAPSVVVPVKNEEPVESPPLTVKPFVPPT